jgi:hypothetical protein
VKRNLTSQGFSIGEEAEAVALSRAARFQPATTLLLVIAGLLLPAGQIAWFGTLAVLGWLAVAWPKVNVFDRLWGLVVTPLIGWPGLGPPPAPRRFSQGMAATFLTLVTTFFALGWPNAALGTGVVMCVAAAAVTFGDLCLGSMIYQALFERRVPS